MTNQNQPPQKEKTKPAEAQPTVQVGDAEARRKHGRVIRTLQAIKTTALIILDILVLIDTNRKKRLK